MFKTYIVAGLSDFVQHDIYETKSFLPNLTCSISAN